MFTKGFQKHAFKAMSAGKVSGLGKHLLGTEGGIKPISRPSRITPSIAVGNPVFGQKGITGVPAQAPFARIQTNFGTSPRKGLVSRTAVSRGTG